MFWLLKSERLVNRWLSMLMQCYEKSLIQHSILVKIWLPNFILTVYFPQCPFWINLISFIVLFLFRTYDFIYKTATYNVVWTTVFRGDMSHNLSTEQQILSFQLRKLWLYMSKKLYLWYMFSDADDCWLPSVSTWKDWD